MIIRLFIISILFLIIVSLTLTDQLNYLSFITTWNVALLIIIFGSVSFIIKTIIYFYNKRSSIPQKPNK
jgi:hypothetical protein